VSAPMPDDPTSEIMEIQMGPSHPASHGTIKFNLRLDGETIADVDVEIGYLHRGFEKMCEQGTWNHVFPYADRLNYASPLLNNVGFALAVEKLAGVTAPERCQYIRVIAGEISRITDHLTCLGMAASEIGAISAGFLMIEAREFLYDLVEALTGARLTVTYCRLGGVMCDLPAGFAERTRDALRRVEAVVADCERLLSRNRIFVDRMAGIGAISRDDAVSWSPPARAATTTTASPCAWRRSSRASASSARRWTRFPPARSRSAIRVTSCPRSRRSTARSRA